ncbi:MAG: histidine--tRNA ligase [Patescibacteria group bacterium]
MKPTTPTTLKGFRDFLPTEKRQRDWLVEQMKAVFEQFGFQPLETPTIEYAELLLGKYGDEADKLVYNFTDRGDRQVALRYDQTVPTARVLAQYQNVLPRYFRRYQFGNVFRADKPQKGRFREFMQSDCDVFGSSDPLADAEILAVFYAVYAAIGLESIQLQINDRQQLVTTLEPFALPEAPVLSLTQTLDKLDKIGATGVADELVSKGLSADAAATLLGKVEKNEKSELLQKIEQYATALGIPQSALVYNPYLARGLDYYTGLIFEGQVPEYTVGSVGGGGRYDTLINDLSGVQMPAVGFGIGFDRTLEAAREAGTIPQSLTQTQVFVTIFNEALAPQALTAAKQLRQAGIATEISVTTNNLGKQFRQAAVLGIPWVLVIGEEEAAKDQVTLKNLKNSSQTQLDLNAAVQTILAE